MRFIEETEAAWSAEQLAAAEREIEEKKLEWERNRLAAMKEEEERRARELEEENELLTFSREDATNQVSNKSKKISRDRDSTPTVKRLNRKTLNKSTNVLNRADRLNNRRHYSTRNAVSRQSFINKPKATEDEIEETTNDSKSSIDDLKSELEQSCEDDKVTNDNQSENFDEDERSLDSEDECYKTSNHVDHNSPRTRSRGTVEIDLWTLDINPLLPGIKPIKSSTPLNTRRRRIICKDKMEKSTKRSKSDSENEKVDSKSEKKQKIEIDTEIKDKGGKKVKLDDNEDSKTEKSSKLIKPNVETQTNSSAEESINTTDAMNEDNTGPQPLKSGDFTVLPTEIDEQLQSDSNDAKVDLKCTKRKQKKDDKIENEDNVKKIKKKNGNKDIQLQKNVEKLMNDNLVYGDQSHLKTEEKVLATLVDVIEESDKNGKISIDHNKALTSKTLKVMLSSRDVDKYLHNKDGASQNHSDLQNHLENLPDTSLSSTVVNHDNSKPHAHQAKAVTITTTIVKNSRRLGSSPKTVKKTADFKNSTLDAWLLQSPSSEKEARTTEVDNSISSMNDSDTVEENKVLCELERTSNCDELTVNESGK